MNSSKQALMYELGADPAEKTWVYLCGLTDGFDSGQETENRRILDQLGKRRGIRFLALRPFDRCERARNQLCWRHYSKEETLQTYGKILNSLGDWKVSGFIGFSNGGYFLNQLVQLQKLTFPIISIGAAGTFFDASLPNRVALLIGKNEAIYKDAQLLHKKARGTPLSVTLTEHEGGHILPGKELEDSLINFAK